MSTMIKSHIGRMLEKIILARSQEEVKVIINLEMGIISSSRELQEQLITGLLVTLRAFDPLKASADQWTNINMARIHLGRISRELVAATSSTN